MAGARVAIRAIKKEADVVWTQNLGRHESLHRTLQEGGIAPSESLAGQRDRFLVFQHCFNEERPHQALLMQTPASLYRPSARSFADSLDEI